MRAVAIRLARLAHIRPPGGEFEHGYGGFIAASGKVLGAPCVLEPPECETSLNLQFPSSRLFSGGGDTGGGSSSGGVALEEFSFFLTSLQSMQALSGSQLGFGGDLRFGEAGPGAGLRGAPGSDRVLS